MADVLCPHCGMLNPDEQNVCSFCHQPLPPKDHSKSIRPGDAPTKKTTAELEPVLPQWLREARDKARRTQAENDADQGSVSAEPPASKEDTSDLLAGLESAAREEQDDEIPEWMRGAASPSTPAKPEKSEPPYPRRQEIHWGDDTEDELGGMATTPIPSAPESGDALLPWMRGTEGTSEEEEVSSWLDSQKPASKEQPHISPFATGTLKPQATGELTDWLNNAASEPEKPAKKEPDSSIDDWLSNLPRGDVPSAAEESAEPFGGENIDLPDWMKPVTTEKPEAESKPASPDWMESTAQPPIKPDQEGAEASLPDWMKPTAEPFEEAKEKKTAPSASDWLASFREQEFSAEAPPPLAESTPEVPHAPAFVPAEGSSDSGQADELFSIEMPDWLSNIAPTEEKPAVGEPQEQIAPAELPSWVQAMRPVETVLPGSSLEEPTVEGILEENGPLAGLRGVLPLAEGLFQPGKPKAQALRLQASDAQQADATLLEQILAAETQAEPIRGSGSLVSQRALRWVIAALLIALVTFSLLSGSQSVPLPAALPEESNLILPVLDALPEGAPVLMVFDYEPALAGELEATAAPFVDRLLGLRHPHLTILSTSPTGAALAERFLSSTQSRHNYQLGQNYIDLGYLPGGTTGILSFAENPRAAMPSSAWTNPPAQNVNRFSDYAAVILFTDQAESARAWVEQTAAQRENRPLLVVSSAQAAPMIQPYLLSGQVNGLVSGLHGGAAFESSSGLDSPVRRYWDAFNFATLFVVLFISVGGLWNLFIGARTRRQSLQGLDEA